jgi:hypothetical protein
MSDTQFYLYAGLLTISGILLLTLAITGFGQSVGIRVVNALLGLGFTGYGVYLLTIFDGVEVRIFFYAFIVPIAMVVYAVKNYRAGKAEDLAPPPGPPAPQQAPPYGG